MQRRERRDPGQRAYEKKHRQKRSETRLWGSSPAADERLKLGNGASDTFWRPSVVSDRNHQPVELRISAVYGPQHGGSHLRALPDDRCEIAGDHTGAAEQLVWIDLEDF